MGECVFNRGGGDYFECTELMGGFFLSAQQLMGGNILFGMTFTEHYRKINIRLLKLLPVG